MENPTVIITDTGELQLTSITRHCLLHTIEVIRPHINLSIVLPQSGSHKIDSFCGELQEAILTKHPKKRSTQSLPEDPLVPSIEIHRLCEGAIGSLDFTLIIEKNFLATSKGNINLDAFHRCCWKYYEMERKSEISYPKWFSRECTYRLWLIYNCVLEPDLNTTLSMKTTNEVLKRIVEYCGYTWNPTYAYATATQMSFPEYLAAITTYFEQFKLEMSLTCEVIGDMVDEIVNGVLKTGRLTKKGHMRKNWKNRWFVLQRTVLRYYMSRDNMTLKGQLVLNGNTEVKSIPDKGKRRFCFHVTCGHTGTPFEIAAEDQRTKHEWMLAIRKAIALAKVLDGSSKANEFAESLQGFYLLKYGTSQPVLARQDSTVRKMKFQATLKDQRKRLSGRDSKTTIPTSAQFDSSGEVGDDLEQYVAMGPGQGNITSDDSDSDTEGQYVPMKPLSIEELSQSYDEVTIHVTQSLPPTIGERSFMQARSSGTFSGPFVTTQDKPLILEPTPEEDEGGYISLKKEAKKDLTYDPVSFEDGNRTQQHAYDPVTYDDKDRMKSKTVSRRKSDPKSPSLLCPTSLSPTSLSPEFDDGKDGSYIHVVHSRPNIPPNLPSQTVSTPNALESSASYDEPKNWTVKKDSGLYLTLIHDSPKSPTYTENGIPKDHPPTVPAHRKSPSPIHKHRFTMSERFDLPPPPPPRMNMHASSPNLPRAPPPLPPTRRRSSDSPTSPVRVAGHSSVPPPLPSKNSSGSPTSPIRNLSSSSPEHSFRRATIMSPTKEYPRIIEEPHALLKRRSFDDGEPNTNS
ncbi:uncharacterized protein LOC135341815 [Halichondria panicea]|uniref:uncharacterized protein LOC135341815 n=1 Tax=Halichondria panicea TaxID=6063 RepID=UPI00312BB033